MAGEDCGKVVMCSDGRLSLVLGEMELCCVCTPSFTCDECATQFYTSGIPSFSLANTITTRHDPPPFSSAYYSPAPAQMSISPADLSTALNAMPDSIKSYMNNGGANNGVEWVYPDPNYNQSTSVWNGSVSGTLGTYPEIVIPNSYVEIEKLRTTSGSQGFQGNLWGVNQLSIQCETGNTIKVSLVLSRWLRGQMNALQDVGLYSTSEGGSPILDRYTQKGTDPATVSRLTFTSSYTAVNGIWDESTSCGLAFPQTSGNGVFSTSWVDQMITNSSVTWG